MDDSNLNDNMFLMAETYTTNNRRKESLGSKLLRQYEKNTNSEIEDHNFNLKWIDYLKVSFPDIVLIQNNTSSGIYDALVNNPDFFHWYLTTNKKDNNESIFLIESQNKEAFFVQILRENEVSAEKVTNDSRIDNSTRSLNMVQESTRNVNRNSSSEIDSMDSNPSGYSVLGNLYPRSNYSRYNRIDSSKVITEKKFQFYEYSQGTIYIHIYGYKNNQKFITQIYRYFTSRIDEYVVSRWSSYLHRLQMAKKKIHNKTLLNHLDNKDRSISFS